ncbi:hypothetical protein C8R43DRAFT_1038454 [Mycena crocata]|nr:hypothetical protein C8R43DRAFT_1038454 [Mycena crocata]
MSTEIDSEIVHRPSHPPTATLMPKTMDTSVDLNIALSPAEASRLRTRLTRIDEEVKTLESGLRRLAAERRQLLQRLESVIYPVLNLPPEITGKIFTHYVDNPRIGCPRESPDSPPYSGGGPLVLASVCRNWRDISHSLCPLWASLHLYPEQHSSIENLVSLLRRWFSRAGTHPLDLHITEPSISLPGTVLSEFSSQWRNLGLTLGSNHAFPNDAIRGRVPSLTKLVINFEQLPETVPPPTIITAFSEAPHLREVHLSGVTLQSISLPWRQLTHLRFSDGIVEPCMEILHHTPNLEVLDIPTFIMRVSWELPPLRLAHLHTLKLAIYGPDLRILLGHLTLPALITIHLTFFLDMAPIQHMVERSECLLKKMVLLGTKSDVIQGCLQCAPSLEQVEIYRPLNFYMAPLVKSLANDNLFLPALRGLKLEANSTDISILPLTDMLTSRWRGANSGVTKLESFRLRVLGEKSEKRANELSDGILTRLRPIIEEGFDVVIHIA